ncbi:hypothetical protein [Sinorhizobium fredii]|uniref:hypothetical protein n=1 Tax=Rhizobium fredii TaxID=380 RepID=UPI00055A7B87|nr:hypothetical protein [Sinorhizobium fredii]
MDYIEHLPFEGKNYNEGISGRKIAIVGYSHHHDDPSGDNTEFTRFTIRQVISGQWKPRFFTVIRNSFGYSSHDEFWNKVLFFNYVPMMIGVGAERYKWANEEQADIANARFLRVLDDYAPDCVFVFTKKTRLGALDLDFAPMPSPLQSFVAATRSTPAAKSVISRLRHPQGANGHDLRVAIRTALGCEETPEGQAAA